jgi:hypothetical protein
MPDTARRFGVANRFDEAENIRAGVEYLATLLRLFSGDITLALAAYNAGENVVARHAGIPPFPETREYVRRTLVAYRGASRPLLGGGFRGREIAPEAAAASPQPARGAPVRVASVNGTPVLTNVDLTNRIEPLLGRVR